MFRLSAACAALLICGPLAAQTVYRCQGADGKFGYQDKPCAAGHTQSERNVAPAAAGIAAPPRAAAPVAQAPAAPQEQPQSAQARGPDLDFAAQQGRVLAGMSKDQVRRAWGQPNEVRSRMGDVGLQEMWYWRVTVSQRREVMFTNGVVSLVDERIVD